MSKDLDRVRQKIKSDQGEVERLGREVEQWIAAVEDALARSELGRSTHARHEEPRRDRAPCDRMDPDRK